MDKTNKNIPYPLMEEKERNRDVICYGDRCDRYDYLAAVSCGVIGGVIDIFCVNFPKNSTLGAWTDDQINGVVRRFAVQAGWNPREEQRNSMASAIGFLEKKFKVNYDQRYSADVESLFSMSTKNHHMKSLAHSPDVIGLFFSILNQFTSTSSFISDGHIITMTTDTFELQGSNYMTRLFCGTVNWFGHIMSDMAGSSGSAGNNRRGTGIVMPFYELFQFCQFGKIDIGKDKQDLATLATRAYQEGYDFRFGLTMSVPVVITDLLIRFVWSFRQYFQYSKALKECIPVQKHDNLRIMLLLGNGTLCLMDGIDAGVRSGGNFLVFFMRLNLMGWLRFVGLVFKEVCIRIGLSESCQSDIAAFRKINKEVESYLTELQKIDISLYEKETTEYVNIMSTLFQVKTEKELNHILIDSFDELGLLKPWQGDFDEFMRNADNRMIFK